jgi:hypothetical protein
MYTVTQSSPNYDFRKDFDRITRPCVIRFLDTSAKLLGDNFDADRRAGYGKEFVLTVRRSLRSEQRDAALVMRLSHS